MKYILVLTSLMAALVLPCIGQERTAGGSLSTEASWNALQSMINATNGNVATLRTDMDAMKACAKEGKLWKPGEGCILTQAVPQALETPTCSIANSFVTPNYGGANGLGTKTSLATYTNKGYSCVKTGEVKTRQPNKNVEVQEYPVYLCSKITCQ